MYVDNYKEPFQDKFGQWWCFRGDHESLDAGALPLGPFFNADYAFHTTRDAQRGKAPIKLFGKQPVNSMHFKHL